MRELSPGVLTLLESRQGIDSVLVVGIQWTDGNESLYCDKNLTGIAGKIIDLGQLESVSRLDGQGKSNSLSFSIDDSDGSIKNIIDSSDVVFKKVKVYQCFDQLGVSNKILLYEGVLASPIEWDHSTRIIQMTAIDGRFNNQVGFSLDEAAVSVFHQNLLNQAWPMIFGTPLHVPMLPLTQTLVGTTTKAFGIADPMLAYKTWQLKNEANTLIVLGPGVTDSATSYDPTDPISVDLATSGIFETSPEEAAAGSAIASAADQKGTEIRNALTQLQKITDFQNQYTSPFNKVIGGYAFPQGKPLLCKINESLVVCNFLGGKTLPNNPDDACPVHIVPFYLPVYYVQGKPIVKEGFKFLQAGSQLQLIGDLPGGYKYVASITPGSVLAISAYRNFNGIRRLQVIPPRFYKIETETLTPVGITEGTPKPIAVTYVILKKPMSTVSFFADQITTNLLDYEKALLAAGGSTTNGAGSFPSAGTQVQGAPTASGATNITGSFIPGGLINGNDWEDELYVTFQSSIGPLATDVIKFLVETYTPYTCDKDSFESVGEALANYPVNFALTDRPIVDNLIQDIAYQSRCAVWLKEEVYYIKYLSILPTPTDTITQDDIVFGSLKITASSSDNLITKYIASYRNDYIQPTNELVIKYNVNKYGIVEDSHDFYIYNNYSLVQKSASFWALRRGVNWKIVECEVFLQKLGIETLDSITLSLPSGLVSNSDIICQVESCIYDSNRNVIALTLWTGVPVGSLKQDPFAYPAGVTSALLSPLYNAKSGGGSANLIEPTIGFYNNMQSIIVEGDPSISANGKPQQLGYTPVPYGQEIPGDLPSQYNTPQIFGDQFPSDLNDLMPPTPTAPQASFEETDYALDAYAYDLPEIPPDSTIYDLTKKPSTYSGKVLSGSGVTWRVQIYPKGFNPNDPSANTQVVTAIETHNNPKLTGLIGEWVDVVMRTDTTQDPIVISYAFSFEQTKIGLGVIQSGEGDSYKVVLYPNGFEADPGETVDLTVPNILATETIPTDTKITGIVKAGDTYYYQPPIWV